MCMTDTNVKKTCKYHTKLQIATNTAGNRVQTLKNSGVVNDTASKNKKPLRRTPGLASYCKTTPYAQQLLLLEK